MSLRNAEAREFNRRAHIVLHPAKIQPEAAIIWDQLNRHSDRTCALTVDNGREWYKQIDEDSHDMQFVQSDVNPHRILAKGNSGHRATFLELTDPEVAIGQTIKRPVAELRELYVYSADPLRTAGLLPNSGLVMSDLSSNNFEEALSRIHILCRSFQRDYPQISMSVHQPIGEHNHLELLIDGLLTPEVTQVTRGKVTFVSRSGADAAGDDHHTIADIFRRGNIWESGRSIGGAGISRRGERMQVSIPSFGTVEFPPALVGGAELIAKDMFTDFPNLLPGLFALNGILPDFD